MIAQNRVCYNAGNTDSGFSAGIPEVLEGMGELREPVAAGYVPAVDGRFFALLCPVCEAADGLVGESQERPGKISGGCLGPGPESGVRRGVCKQSDFFDLLGVPAKLRGLQVGVLERSARIALVRQLVRDLTAAIGGDAVEEPMRIGAYNLNHYGMGRCPVCEQDGLVIGVERDKDAERRSYWVMAQCLDGGCDFNLIRAGVESLARSAGMSLRGLVWNGGGSTVLRRVSQEELLERDEEFREESLARRREWAALGIVSGPDLAGLDENYDGWAEKGAAGSGGSAALEDPGVRISRAGAVLESLAAKWGGVLVGDGEFGLSAGDRFYRGKCPRCLGIGDTLLVGIRAESPLAVVTECRDRCDRKEIRARLLALSNGAGGGGIEWGRAYKVAWESAGKLEPEGGSAGSEPEPVGLDDLQAEREAEVEGLINAAAARVGALRVEQGDGNLWTMRCPVCFHPESEFCFGSVESNPLIFSVRCFAESGCRPRDMYESLERLAGIKIPRVLRMSPVRKPAEAGGGNGESASRREGESSDENQAGRWLGRKLAGQYRFDELEGTGWWAYNAVDGTWRSLQKDSYLILDWMQNRRFQLAGELEAAGERSLAKIFGEPSNWGRMRQGSGDFWSGMRYVLTDLQPRAELHLINVWETGVVDLRTGEVHKRDPKYGCRAITAGRYLPKDEERHWSVLRTWLGSVFSEGMLQDYIRLLALYLSGRGQTYTGLTAITGLTESGKGGTANLARESLGSYGSSVTVSWFGSGSGRGEIDSLTASLLERDVRVLTCDEIGAAISEKHGGISEHALLTRTGDTIFYGRRPHGPPLSGYLRCGVITTCVDPPAMKADTGIQRRLVVLPTLGKLREEDKKPDFARNQELMDAVVTLAVISASAVYEDGYRAPRGAVEEKREMMATMDPLWGYLEELEADEWHGRPLSEVATNASDLLEKVVSAQDIGRRLARGKNRRWIGVQGQGRDKVKYLWLRERAMPDGDGNGDGDD